MPHRLKIFTACIGLLLGLGLLWLAVKDVNFADSRDSLVGANHWLALPVLASLYAFYWLKARRWGQLLEPTLPLSHKILLPSLMVGFAGNNLLPFRLGEALRVYLVGFDIPQSRSFALGTLLVERIFDIVAIVALVALACLFLPFELTESLVTRSLLVAALAVLLAVGLAFVNRLPVLSTAGDRLIQLLPRFAVNWLRPRLLDARRSFGVLSQFANFPAIIANSLAQWALVAAAIYVSMSAVDIDVTPAAAGIVLGLLVIGLSLPAAPGFVGTIEYCFVAGLGFFGVPANAAFAAAIFYHVLAFGYVVIVGAFYLRRYGVSSEVLSGLKEFKNRDS